MYEHHPRPHPVDLCDESAVKKVLAVRPHCTGVHRLDDVIRNTNRRIFHAGPPYRSLAEIPAPVLNSAAQAVVYEGWCHTVTEAIEAIREGQILMASAQANNLMVPLAGVLSASMAVLEISDPKLELASVFVALNEGQVHATRLGRLDDGLLPHLHWLNGLFAGWVKQCLVSPLDLLPLLVQARLAGDDCHARTVVGSEMIAAELLKRGSEPGNEIRNFLKASPAFALNFWMGATALAASVAEGLSGSSLITRAGGNGVEFGIQLAAHPGRWICCPAPIPKGMVEAVHVGRHAVGALGDSAVVDFSGLGGQSLHKAPLVAQGVELYLPSDVARRPSQVLASAGRDVSHGLGATSAFRCVEAGAGPLILIGMIDAQGQSGRIGSGVIDVSVAIFEQALKTL
ncbi:MAG TPA: DUF1116 domain-containing protein [Rhodoferax sp.]|nr:DUF1116 domain-containing protein [Rhodoferax sp.]